jgi:hypothetical protein
MELKREDGSGRTNAWAPTGLFLDELTALYIYLGDIEILNGRRQRRLGACLPSDAPQAPHHNKTGVAIA